MLSFTQRAIRDGTLAPRTSSALGVSPKRAASALPRSLVSTSTRIAITESSARGEQVLEAASQNWTVLRATQFHAFVDRLLTMSKSAAARVPTNGGRDARFPFSKDLWLQPVSHYEVAARIVDLVEAGPTNTIEQFAGPEQFVSQDLAQKLGGRSWRTPFWMPTVGRFLAPSRMAQRSQAPTLSPGLPPGPTTCQRPTDVVNESGGRLLALAQRTPLAQGLPGEVGVLAAIAFCVALGFGIVALRFPCSLEPSRVTALLAGAVISVFALMRLITSPGAGALVNRVGERVVLSTGLAIVAVSSFAGFAQDYVRLLVLRGVGELAQPCSRCQRWRCSCVLLDLNSAVEQRARSRQDFSLVGLLARRSAVLLSGSLSAPHSSSTHSRSAWQPLWPLCFCGLPNRSRHSGSRTRAARRRRQLNQPKKRLSSWSNSLKGRSL